MSSFIESIESALEKIAAAKEKIVELAEQVTTAVSSGVSNIINDTDGPLVGENRILAASIFGDSLDYDAIIINDTSFMADINQQWNNGSRPFVLGNTVNSNNPLTQEELIHELTHVWQYQTGGLGYITDSISDNTYSYDANLLSSYAGLPEGERLQNFNVEQQAEIVSHYFVLSNQTLPLAPEGITLHNMVDSNGDPIVITNSNIDQYLQDMQPYIEEIQNTPPQEGLIKEINEAPIEIIEEGGEGIEEVAGEIHEGINEIGNEIENGNPTGVVTETAEAVGEVLYESGEGAVETIYEVGEGTVEIGVEGAKDVFGWLGDKVTGD